MISFNTITGKVIFHSFEIDKADTGTEMFSLELRKYFQNRKNEAISNSVYSEIFEDFTINGLFEPDDPNMQPLSKSFTNILTAQEQGIAYVPLNRLITSEFWDNKKNLFYYITDRISSSKVYIVVIGRAIIFMDKTNYDKFVGQDNLINWLI